MMQGKALVLLSAVLPLGVMAQDRCTAQGLAEQDRIVRAYASAPPTRGDREAELVWSKKLNAELADAAQRAEQCSRSSQQQTQRSGPARQQDCVAAIDRRADDLEGKYRGRALSPREQATRRAEEQQLLDERMACRP